MNIKHTLALSVLLAFGASGTALANDDYTAFDTWDRDVNGYVDANEYESTFADAGMFDDWDANDDGLLDDNEFGMASSDWDIDGNAFDSWDANDDGFLDDDEMSAGLFETWDVDDDNQLVGTEYDDADEAGWFDW